MITHPIEPVYDSSSEILILGSFPSVKSREEGFFYGNRQNRFWIILSELFGEETPENIPSKKEFLLKHKIALWDVIHSCDISLSSDSSIKNVIPNDLNIILGKANIKEIFVNGKAAKKYYDIYAKELTGKEATYLPSTSPANAAWSKPKLLAEWKNALEKYIN